MKFVIYLSLCLLGLVRLAEASRPRGVRAELASMYNPNQDFKCFDGSNVIPFNHINDDYCDCQVRRHRILSCCLSHSSPSGRLRRARHLGMSGWQVLL